MSTTSVSAYPRNDGRSSAIQNAEAEGELGAIIAEQLRQAPTLQQTAREALVFWLTRCTCHPNPDAIFIHRQEVAGAAIKPLSLTHALLHAFFGDRSYIDDMSAILSWRMNSAGVQHQPRELDMAALKTVFRDALSRLAGMFNFSLNGYWEDEEHVFPRIPGEGAVTGERHEILAGVQQRIFDHAIRGGVNAKQLTVQDENLLSDAMSGVTQNVFSVALQTAEGELFPLGGVFVVSGDGMDLATITGRDTDTCVYMVSPGLGVEKFDTLKGLQDSLRRRLDQERSADQVTSNLSLEHQVRVERMALSTLRLDFKRLSDKPAWRLISDLRQKQLDDIEYLSDQARHNTDDLGAMLRMFDDASQSADMIDMLGTRYIRLLQFIDSQSRPDWLKWAHRDDVRRYEELKAERDLCETAVRKLTQGVDSFEQYARDEIEAWLEAHLGYTPDPQRVMVNIPDRIALGTGLLETTYSRSLLHFAMNGLPSIDSRSRPGIKVDPAMNHPDLDFDFVERLVGTLDLGERHVQEVQRRYHSLAMRKAMVGLQASELGLSLLLARLQGHLSGRGAVLIEQALSGSSQSLQSGALFLKSGSRRFEDVLVLRATDAEGELYVLYAPGLPGGRSLFDFSTWRQLSQEVGGWTANAPGAQYLLDQVGGGADQDLSVYVESIRLKPVKWEPDSVIFAKNDTGSFDETLGRFYQYKVERILERGVNAVGSSGQDPAPSRDTEAVTLGYRIAALESAYKTYEIVSWRVAARRECKRLIDAHLKASGIPGQIDPDTVYCDLKGEQDGMGLDLGRYSALKCLTDLFMAGYSNEDYEFHTGALLHSSIGQDISGLSASFIDSMIRGSDYADEYIKQLRAHQWSMTNRPPKRALELFSRKMHYEMIRDAKISLSRGHITPPEYNWLIQEIVSHDDSSKPVQVVDGTLHPLLMEYVHIRDVHLFKPKTGLSHLRTLAYTPKAPDGYLFRPELDIVTSVQRPGMPQYYYDKATYSRQRIIGTLMQKLEVSPIVDGQPYAVRLGEAIGSYQSVHSTMINLLIVDIDSQTQSKTERRMLKTYDFVRKYGGEIADLNPLTSAMWHAFHAGVDLFRGIYAYQEGDRARARDFFISAAKEAFKTAKKVRKLRKTEKSKRLKPRGLPSLSDLQAIA